MATREILIEIDHEAQRISRELATRRSPRSPVASMAFRPQDQAAGDILADGHPRQTRPPDVPARPARLEVHDLPIEAKSNQDGIEGAAPQSTRRAETIARRLFDMFGMRALKNLFGRR